MDRTSLPTGLHVRILYRSVCPFSAVLSAFGSNMDDFFTPKMSALRSNLSQHKAGSFRDKRKYPYMAGKVTSRLKKGVTLFTEFCKRQYWMRGFWFLPCFKFPKVCYKNGKRISDNGDKHGGRETCGAW